MAYRTSSDLLHSVRVHMVYYSEPCGCLLLGSYMSCYRFLVVVLSAYKQIRAQSSNVLMDVDDENFDKAFAFFRPGTRAFHYPNFGS